MAQNYRSIAKKLQTAIAIKHDRRISINYFQQYSTKQKRTVTKYVLSEYDQNKKKYVTLFKSWQLPEIVQFLGNIYQSD